MAARSKKSPDIIPDNVIKELISRVNCTLSYFEKDYISVIRTPFTDKERCTSFEQYVEARFNYECLQIPELYHIVVQLDGHLFQCVCLEDQDLVKRRFSTAHVVLIDPSTLVTADESLKNEIIRIAHLIGGTSIKFNNVKKKIKFLIE